MSDAFWAYGSLLQLGDAGSPEAFASIAEITEGPEGPDMSRESIDVTNHQSSVGWKEKIPGMRDGGSLSGKANWLPNNTTHDENTGLLAHFKANTKRNWKIVLPGGLGTFTFSAFATKFKLNLDLNKQGELEFELDITGPVLFDGV